MIGKIKLIKKSELGFTLIEVMVVIIMVGILAAIAVPIYTNYVYRARTSEAVSTLGAVKTFVMERRNAKGVWPTKTEILDEFNNFNELYYFEGSEKVGVVSSENTITITLLPDPNNFDPPDKYKDKDISLTIDWENAENGGWGGELRDKWADHLPKKP